MGNIEAYQDGSTLYLRIDNCSKEEQCQIEQMLQVQISEKVQGLSPREEVSKKIDENELKQLQIQKRNELMQDILLLKEVYQSGWVSNKRNRFYKVALDWVRAFSNKMKEVPPAIFTDDQLIYMLRIGRESFWNVCLSSFLQAKNISFDDLLNGDRKLLEEAYLKCN